MSDFREFRDTESKNQTLEMLNKHLDFYDQYEKKIANETINNESMSVFD